MLTVFQETEILSELISDTIQSSKTELLIYFGETSACRHLMYVGLSPEQNTSGQILVEITLVNPNGCASRPESH